MKIVSFEDTPGICETALLPKVYHQCCHMLSRMRPYILKGKVEEALGSLSLTVHRIGFLDRHNQGNSLWAVDGRRPSYGP